MHWADRTVKWLINKSDKDEFVSSSGVSPSGSCHVGHLREALTSNLVAEALEEKGLNSRHIHVWDDYDRFRKVPENVPDEYEDYIGMPLCDVPDPDGCHESYADHFMEPFEEELEMIGIQPEFVRASEKYRNGEYVERIKESVNKKSKIREELDKYREEPLDKDWWPIQVYCEECGKDFTEIISFDMDKEEVEYECECGNKEQTNLIGNVKMRWRVDWPARWKHFKVDYEPAGKEHHAAGGSWDTGKEIAELFNYDPPISIAYEFVFMKGQEGKMSSSEGNVLLVEDLLNVVEPEVLRYLYGKTRPKSELWLDLGLGLLDSYDKFDELEDKYFDGELDDEDQRIYELSRIDIPNKKPAHPTYRFLATLVQIPNMNIDKIVSILQDNEHFPKNPSNREMEKLETRVELARNWVNEFAPDSMKFNLKKKTPDIKLGEKQRRFLGILSEEIKKGEWNAVDLHNKIYEISREEADLEPKKAFQAIYKVLLGDSEGPKAAKFILSLDVDFVVKRFEEFAQD